MLKKLGEETGNEARSSLKLRKHCSQVKHQRKQQLNLESTENREKRDVLTFPLLGPCLPIEGAVPVCVHMAPLSTLDALDISNFNSEWLVS